MTPAHRLIQGMGLLLALAWSGSSWAGSCQLTTPSFNLGTYNTYNALSATATDTMTVTCSATTPAEQTTGVVATVTLSAGNSGNPQYRSLTMGGDVLYYNIYLDANLTTVFGDGTHGTQTIQTCQGGTACGSTGSLTVPLYSAAPPHQDPTPGAYQDSLILNVVF